MAAIVKDDGNDNNNDDKERVVDMRIRLREKYLLFTSTVTALSNF